MKQYKNYYILGVSIALTAGLIGPLKAQEAYSSVGANYGKVYNSTGSASSKNYGSSTSSSDLTSAQASGLQYSDPGTTVNQTTADGVSSGYTGSAPSSLTSGFSASTLAPPGRTKITECAATGTSSTNSNSECNAVNFMASNPGQTLSVSSTDPILTAAANTLSGATTTGVTTSSVCTTQNAIVPATNSTETCNDYIQSYTSTCTETIDSCPFVPATISSMSTSGPTSVAEVSTGLYNYSMSMGGCGTNAYASIVFNLDSASQGGYITANSSSLDDAAVIAINGIVVFYGHPNSGGSWYYPTFGTTSQFVLGYQDTLYQDQCVSYDWENSSCNGYGSVAVATSQFKLSDSCPISGDYSNKTGATATWCTADGKLVGRVVEGNNYGGISLNGAIALKSGQNKIEMFWGTEGSGNYCGGITLTGQIYNVAPICEVIDGCQSQKAVLK